MFERLKLAKRLDELEEQLLKLTRIVQDRDLDWEDMRARCKRLLDRTEKAAKRVVESEPSGTSEAPSEVPEWNGNDGRSLSPKQRAIQQQILRRRAGL